MLAMHTIPLSHSLLDAMLSHDAMLMPDVFMPSNDRPRMTEDDSSYALTVNCPGVKSEDLTVSIDGDVVKIDGETRTAHATRVVHSSTSVPRGADPEKATVTHADGVVTVAIPKKPAAVPMRIEVTPTEEADGEMSDDDDDTKSGYRLTLPVPGIAAADCEVLAKEGLLRVDGESKRTGARVLKCFRLPKDADAASAKATCAHGLLTVTVPKRAPAEARTLGINVAAAAKDEGAQGDAPMAADDSAFEMI